MHRFAIALVALTVSLAVRADDKGTLTDLDGLKSTTPANWKSEKPMGMNRVYQFTIPKSEGEKFDTTWLIFQSPGGAGGVEANIARWKNRVKPAEGAKPEDAYKTSEFAVGDAKVTMFEATGIYMFKARPMDTQAEARPDHKFI